LRGIPLGISVTDLEIEEAIREAWVVLSAASPSARRLAAAGPSRVWGCPIELGIAGQMFHQRWIRNGAGFALDEEWDRHASG
jgi:hypothetical protein